MKKFPLIFFLAAAAALWMTACSPSAAEPTAVVEATQPAGIIAEGRLQPVNALDQSFSMPGQVREILVKDGDSVQAGQVLARLSDSPEAKTALARAQQEALIAQQALDALNAPAEVNLAQAQLAVVAAQTGLETAQEAYDAEATDETQAELDAAKAALQQAEDTQARLTAGDGVDPDQLAAAEARLTSAAAAAASAQAAIDALELKASMDGTLVDLSLQAGQRVSAGQAVMTLADTSSWVVKTDNLTEVDVVNLKVGQPVEIVLDALPAVTLSGEVTHINARYEEKRGDITYTVTAALNQTDPLMRWGMTAAVHFVP